MKLIIILSLISLSLMQVAIVCSVDSDCNHHTTENTFFCSSSNACVKRPTFNHKTTITDVNGMCSDSHRNLLVCAGYSVGGCPVPDADLLFTVCVGGSSYDLATKTCKAGNTTATTVGEGVRCDPAASPAINCQSNLVCRQKVCRKRLLVGDNCFGSPLGCTQGLVCDNDICIIKHSRFGGERCKVNDACLNEVCTNGICAEKRSVPCWTNSDCTSISNVCFKTSETARGTCLSGNEKAHSEIDACLASKCQENGASEETCCPREYVKEVCADECLKRPDLRTKTDGYIYDCTALTRTLQTTTNCGYKQSITNCPTTPFSFGVKNTMSLLLGLFLIVSFF